jgi:hypothetical protein
MKPGQIGVKESSFVACIVVSADYFHQPKYEKHRGESGLLELKNLYFAQASMIQSIYQSPARLTQGCPVHLFRAFESSCSKCGKTNLISS